MGRGWCLFAPAPAMFTRLLVSTRIIRLGQLRLLDLVLFAVLVVNIVVQVLDVLDLLKRT